MKNLTLVALLTLCFIHVWPVQQAQATEIATQISLSVEGMTCRSCEAAIKRTVGALPGVTSVTASHKEKRVTVSFDDKRTTLASIKDAISGLGYKVN